MTWNAARAANNRPLKKPIKFGNPVGDNEFNLKAGDDKTCRGGCGYSVCNCEYVPPFPEVKGGSQYVYGFTNQGLRIIYQVEIPHGMSGWVNGYNAILCGLLKKSELEKVKAFVRPAAAGPNQVIHIT